MLEKWVDIFEEVWDVYKMWRFMFLYWVYNFEKVLDILVKIYYKYEGVSLLGFYKFNIVVL